MFTRSFMDFDDDPFFSAHHEHMREMDRMMSGFGAFSGFGRPFGSPFGMLEGPQEQSNRERSMVPRHDDFMGGFDSMFQNMNSMISQMHRNFNDMASSPNGYSYSSSKVMSYSNDGRGEPKYFEASSSTKTAPGGVKETQKTMRDSESGIHKMAVGHHIGERGHVIEKSRNLRTEQEEQKQDFFNIDENDAQQFDREWKEKTRGFHPRNGISGYIDDGRRQGGENRRRTTPALGHRAHRERESRERHREGDERKQKKEKKVRIAEKGSHL